VRRAGFLLLPHPQSTHTCFPLLAHPHSPDTTPPQISHACKYLMLADSWSPCRAASSPARCSHVLAPFSTGSCSSRPDPRDTPSTSARFFSTLPADDAARGHRRHGHGHGHEHGHGHGRHGRYRFLLGVRVRGFRCLALPTFPCSSFSKPQAPSHKP
jgi:hypothetical protein